MVKIIDKETRDRSNAMNGITQTPHPFLEDLGNK
jgi:hypothetical protein